MKYDKYWKAWEYGVEYGGCSFVGTSAAIKFLQSRPVFAMWGNKITRWVFNWNGPNAFDSLYVLGGWMKHS